jgi:DNA-binding LacI/PurR family transcriptional regulator/signal transduction histidine kinase
VSKRKKNIAIIYPTLSHSVEYNFAQGVKAGLPADQFNILHMSVGWIEKHDEGRNVASQLHKAIRLEDVDGVIVYGAGITNRSKPESILEITNCYPDIPVINVGNVVNSLPSVIFDNRAPFNEFVRHLVEDKQCQNIAFVNGPKDNYDAQERRKGFIEGLEAAGLALPSELDWPGQFGIGSGSFAVRNYLETNDSIPEAIVCANDLSAIGVVNELISQGYKVPEDVKVIGFDDLEYSKIVQVPLTTGRYPIFNMGKAASDAMVDWLDDITPPPTITVQSTVIFRKSTGENGDPRSQIAMLPESNRNYFSRDSNSDRLHISRAINLNENIPTVLNIISSFIYDVGGRSLRYFQVNSDTLETEKVFILNGEEIEIESNPAKPLVPLNLAELFSESSGSDLNWVVSPVIAREHLFGFLLISVLPNESDFTEYLANELSKKNENLLLTQGSEELKSQVMKTEQMATLGRLVSGLAHEINTPLGVSLVAASNLSEEVKKIKGLSDANAMTKSSFDHFLESCDETQQILFSSLKRTADLVASFKKVSVDQHIEERRELNLSEYLDEVLVSLRPRIRQSNVNIVTKFDDDIIVETHAGTWAQLLTNLVLNALIHGFDDGNEHGEIVISLSLKNKMILLKLKDNGIGIEADQLKLIFDPFFTTRRARGGTGLGLHIVYNMVTQKLMGHINVKSNTKAHGDKSGTEFVISIPVLH